MDDKPTIVDPPSGILTSGNQLSIAPTGALAAVLGGDEAHGDRAYRLRELLSARSDWDEVSLHGVQLDVRSPRLMRWRDAILAALGDATLRELSAAARTELEDWDGEVTASSTAPGIIDGFRGAMTQAFVAQLAVKFADRRELDFNGTVGAFDDEAMLRILESRSANLIGSDKPDAWAVATAGWLGVAAERARVETPAAGAAAPTQPARIFATRGERNRLSMRHPAADSLGAAARLAEMPKAPLPGHPTCVRVQTPRFGASQRSAVSPAKLEDAVLVTPGGQSGLPTSPHFRNLHPWWQDGKPYPLLPRETKRRIALSEEETAPASPPAPAPAPVSPSS
jgi:penicillin amidase